MKLDICDINKFVKVNDVKEVTNPIRFDSGFTPTEDGLLSYKIFGIPGSYDRKTLFGYINLKKHFLHPLFYIRLTRLDRRIINIIDGSKYFKINQNGQIEEDKENGNTGIEWFYNNFKKIKFLKNGSMERDKTIDIMEKSKLDEIFIDKFLVVPAFYRDSNVDKLSNGKPSEDELTRLYSKLLSLCSSKDEYFDFMGNLTESKIQNQLVEIYTYFTIKYLKGKDGLIKKKLLGKSVDYCTRAVITADRINSQSSDKINVKFTYIGLPISHCINLFYPFFQYEIKVWAEELFGTINEIKDSKDGKYYQLINPMSYFTTEKIKSRLNLFIKSPESRTEKIKIKVNKNGKEEEVGLNINHDTLKRDFTWLDLLYIISEKVCSDKHVYVSRYPIENYQSIFPCRIKVLTTFRTNPLNINNKYYEDYPIIGINPDFTKGHTIKYIDSVIPSNLYLSGLCGDFDGDTVSIRPIYSQEANEEAERLINSIKYLNNVQNKTSRTLVKEGIQCLYSFTVERPDKGRTISEKEKEEILSYNDDDLTLNKLIELFANTKNNKAKFNPFDRVKLNEKEYYNKESINTTVGRIIFNKILFRDDLIKILGFQNVTVDKGMHSKISNMVINLYKDEIIKVERTHKYFDDLLWLAYSPAYFMIPSLSMDMYVINSKVEKRKKELLEENKESIQKADVFTVNKIENELIDMSKEELKNCPGMDFYYAGNGSLENNFKTSVLMRGGVKDFLDANKYEISSRSLSEGITKEEYYLYANITVAGTYSRAKNTEIGGYAVKKERFSFQYLMADEKGSDCHSNGLMKFDVTEENSSMIQERYAKMKPDKDSPLILLDKENMKKCIGKTIYLRSPLYCRGDKLCNKCLGDFYYKMDINAIGGMIDRVGSTLMQRSMKEFHDTSIKVTNIKYSDYIKKI